LVAEEVSTAEEKRALELYNHLLEVYRDGATLWKADIEAHGYSTGIAGLPRDHIPLVRYYGQTVPNETIRKSFSGTIYRLLRCRFRGHFIDTVILQSLFIVAAEQTNAIQKQRETQKGATNVDRIRN
jgi:hypothetical protein